MLAKLHLMTHTLKVERMTIFFITDGQEEHTMPEYGIKAHYMMIWMNCAIFPINRLLKHTIYWVIQHTLCQII